MSVIIRPIRQSDLVELGRSFIGDGENLADCLQLQENGEGLFLVLWYESEPIGHLYLRWAGSHEIPRISNCYPVASTIKNCPSLDGIWVRPEYRSQGFGTQLILEAKRLAELHGFAQVCLTVDIGNERAKALYDRLGYTDPGIGPFHTFGTYIDSDGVETPWDNGTQLFLMKKLTGVVREA